MHLSRAALVALQQMTGEEGGVFNRDLLLNHWHGHPGPEKCFIFPDKEVSMDVLEELKRAGCITCHYEGFDRDQYRLNDVGRRALKDAGMETKPGKLTTDDIAWLTGTGRFAQ